jgi:hypothetical protein
VLILELFNFPSRIQYVKYDDLLINHKDFML